MANIKLNSLKLTRFLSVTLALFIASCATPERPDPLEKFNRVMYGVDKAFDVTLIGPVARAYDHLPNPVHNSVGNFFDNTFEPATVVNDILQGDISGACIGVGRFLVNTTVGIAGLFDVAKHMGLLKHYNDFGVTLSKWGYKNSAFLYVPLLGPMTIRDSASLAIDYWLLNPIAYIPTDKIRYGVLAVAKEHYRWELLPADKVIKDSFDPYLFVRDAYLQKRSATIQKIISGHHSADDTYVHGEDEPSSAKDETEKSDSTDNTKK